MRNLLGQNPCSSIPGYPLPTRICHLPGARRGRLADSSRSLSWVEWMESEWQCPGMRVIPSLEPPRKGGGWKLGVTGALRRGHFDYARCDGGTSTGALRLRSVWRGCLDFVFRLNTSFFIMSRLEQHTAKTVTISKVKLLQPMKR